MGTDYKYDPFNFQKLQSTGALADSANQYNYKPGQVNSTLDNTNFTQDYFQKSVMNPLLRQYDTAIAPRINDAAAAAGNTFSTRTGVAKQQALQDLQTQATGQLATAARQDNIERSQQQLAAQEFNQQTGLQNAQFGAGQQLNYDTLNKQTALGVGQTNMQGALAAHEANTQGNLAGATLKAQLQQAMAQMNQQKDITVGQSNQQNAYAYNALNSQNQIGLAENAANRQLQSVNVQQGVQNQPLQRMLAALGGGTQLNAVGQGNLDRNYAEFQRTAPENNPWIRTLLGFTGQDPNAVVSPSSMSQISQGVSAGAGALTGLGSLAGALGGGGGAALALPAAYGAGAGALGTLGAGAAATGAELGAGAAASGAGAGIGEGLLALLSFL